MGAELVRVVLNENTLLLSNLLHDRAYIVPRELLSAFQNIEDLVAPHTLINATVLIEATTVWLFLDLSAIGDQKAVILRKWLIHRFGMYRKSVIPFVERKPHIL